MGPLCSWLFISLLKTDEPVEKTQRIPSKESIRRGNIWNLVMSDHNLPFVAQISVFIGWFIWKTFIDWFLEHHLAEVVPLFEKASSVDGQVPWAWFYNTPVPKQFLIYSIQLFRVCLVVKRKIERSTLTVIWPLNMVSSSGKETKAGLRYLGN